MRTDTDLQFLQYCNNEELRSVCDILTHDEKGEIRISEQLTNKDSYLANYPDNCQEMWKDIAKELQLYGGNTFANILFRKGFGPTYESIVFDVCKQLHVDVNEHDTAEQMERCLLENVTERMLDELSPDQLRDIMRKLDVKKKTYTKQTVIAALLTTRAINRRLFIWVFEYIVKMVGDMLVGRGVMYALSGILSRTVGVFFGPIGWILLGGWTAWDIAGPAYRVTIPAVLQISYLRMKHTAK